MQNITVSIIIPVYNVQYYIQRCLESVAAQTYKGPLECLLIDDCGQDDSMKVAEQFITAYHGPITFRIIHHDRNKGLSAARNTGIREAKGDWIYFLDSDDWIIPECIQLMWDCVEKYPKSECVFAGAKSTKGSEWLSFESKDLPDFSNDRDWINQALLKRSVLNMTAWNKLIRKSFIIKNNLLFEEGLIHEDDIWNFEMAKVISNIAICKYNTYVYVIRENSIMADTTNILQNRMGLLKYFVNRITDPYRERQISFIFNFINAHFSNIIPEDIKDDMFYVHDMMIKESRGKQKLALWIYYNAPKCILYNYHIFGRVVNTIGKV